MEFWIEILSSLRVSKTWLHCLLVSSPCVTLGGFTFWSPRCSLVPPSTGRIASDSLYPSPSLASNPTSSRGPCLLKSLPPFPSLVLFLSPPSCSASQMPRNCEEWAEMLETLLASSDVSPFTNVMPQSPVSFSLCQGIFLVRVESCYNQQGWENLIWSNCPGEVNSRPSHWHGKQCS